jgi:hypothetical protein
MKAAITAAILTIVVAITGYAIYLKVTDKQAKDRRDKFQRDSFNGLLPAISGPYLSPGKTSELNFKVVELGTCNVVGLSERGKVLTTTKDGSYSGPSDYRLIARDPDQTKVIKNANRVFMTPNGECFIFRTEQPNGTETTIEMPNGTVTQLDPKINLTFAWRHVGSFTLGTEAFIFFDENITKHYRPFEYYDLTLTKRTAAIHESLTYFDAAHSSELGDICIGFEESLGGHNAYNLAIFKNGEVTAENIPMPHEFFHVKASKDKVAVTAGSDFFERIPYLRTGKSQYERIGVPNGANSAEIYAMNSHREYLMYYEVPNHKRPAGVYQCDSFSCLVSKGKYYLFADILNQFFPSRKAKLEIRQDLMDERGDLVVSGGGKSYLLISE